MSLSRLGNRSRLSDFTWPGFVDGLASLLMVFVFVLMVFVIIQANLAFRISGQDTRITALQRDLLELGNILNIERETNSQLLSELSDTKVLMSALETDNKQLLSQITFLQEELSDKEEIIIAKEADISSLSSQLFELEDNLNAARAISEQRGDEIISLISRLTANEKELDEKSTAFKKQQIELKKNLELIEENTALISTLKSEISDLSEQNNFNAANLAEKEKLLLKSKASLCKQVIFNPLI